MNKAINTAEIKHYLQESQGLERDYLSEIVRSRLIAWRLALIASIIAVGALVAVIGLTPFKEVIPFVLRVDNATGHVDLMTTLRASEQSYGEVVDTYFLNQYVLNRESYDYGTLQTLYDLTALLSHPDIQKEYYTLFEGNDARDKKWGPNVKVRTHVRSITPNPQQGTAVVRFSTEMRHSNGVTHPLQNWIAHIGYQYVDAQMSVEDRRLNPLGFQVISYRVDPETLN